MEWPHLACPKLRAQPSGQRRRKSECRTHTHMHVHVHVHVHIHKHTPLCTQSVVREIRESA
jgi:hypothetical protein